MGRQGTADRSGMGIRRARRTGRRRFAWGDEFTPNSRHMANTWQGNFPNENLRADGWARTSPVRAFPPNGYGVHDMIGNVWEWTTDWYSTKHEADAAKACCVPTSPRGAGPDGSYDPRQTGPASRARCSRAARTSVRRTIAGANARRRVMPRTSTPRPAMSGSDVSSGNRQEAGPNL